MHFGFSHILWGPMGSNGIQKTEKTVQKLKKREFKKPYIKAIRDSCFWDSGRWEWWGIILGWIPVRLSRHLILQNLRNMNFLVIFSILDGGPRKVNDLLTSPSNQFRDYHIWNRIEKLMPQHWNLSPRTLKTLKQNRPTRFQTLSFW